jgi:hypothetical protein
MSDDIFSDAEGIDEIMALVLDQEGPDVLQQLLDHLIAHNIVHADDLEKAANAMAAAGLPQAVMVLEAAAKAPSRAEDEDQCPFDPETDPANYRDWNRRHRGFGKATCTRIKSESAN